jgi:hypothetical protein
MNATDPDSLDAINPDEIHDVEAEPRLVSYRTADIAVALFLLVLSGIVITDSVRLGFNWRPAEGPAPGYFPFYIAVLMALATLVTLFHAVRRTDGVDKTMTSRPGFWRMCAIFVPAVVYVFAISFIGIYVASALYIGAFMYFVGRFAIWKAVAVAFGIALVAFLMFEVWFLVPLPKGPIETLFGF